MKVVYTDKFYEQFFHWQQSHQKIVEKIKMLITSISSNPFEGIGEPEPLFFQLSNCWSRRINRGHMLVYKVQNGVITLLTCRFHYD